MAYYQLRCQLCGSECHLTKDCPPREPSTLIKTCEVNIRGVTTKYVSAEDYDALARALTVQQQNASDAARAADIREKGLQMELAKVKHESDYQWYADRIKALTAQWQAQLDMYRKPFTSIAAANLQAVVDCDAPLSNAVKYTCGVCSAVCSSRENLLFHVRLEAKSGRLRTRDRHISLVAAFNTLYPVSTPVPDRFDLT